MQGLISLKITTQQQRNILSSLVDGLKLNHGDLATLIEMLSHQNAPCDFFRTLATHIIPVIRIDGGYRTFVNHWTRKISASKKEVRDLKEKAVQEVTEAYNKISKRLEGNQLLVKIEELKHFLDEAKECLEGTLPVYLPSHFERAAEALTSVCRLLVINREERLVSDLVDVVYFKEGREAGIAGCYFYNSINKILKENQKWGRDSFDRPYVCWSYLCLLESCWEFEGKGFEGKRLKSDVAIAKNYLNQEEVSKLNRLVNMFIDFAELRALNQQIMTMKDWLKQIEKFLNYTDQQILRHAGQISHKMALAKAEEEYEKYRVQRDKEYLSDFDRELAKLAKCLKENGVE